MDEAIQEAVRRVVDVARDRVRQLQERPRRIGEQNTKAVLIEPVMAALGWDLEDIDEVTREYRRKPQDNPVDYALFLLGAPRMFVEAKEVGTNLQDRKVVSQILGYATVVGVEWCVLTNGDEYRIYNAHAPVDVEEKLFRAATISDNDQDEVTVDTLLLLSKPQMERKLIDTLWRSQFIDRQVHAALEAFLDDHERIARLMRPDLPSLQPREIRDALERSIFAVRFPTVSDAARSITVPVEQPSQRAPSSSRSHDVHLTDLISAGLITPPLQLERRYKGEVLRALIEKDGSVSFGAERYGSLSMAAAMGRRSVIGAPPGRKFPNTNGWLFWKYQDSETGKLEVVNRLRQKYLTGEV